MTKKRIRGYYTHFYGHAHEPDPSIPASAGDVYRECAAVPIT